MALPDLAEGAPDSTFPVLRVVSVAGAIIAAVAHLPPTPAHLREVPYIGLGFVVLTALCLSAAFILATPSMRLAWRPAWTVAIASCTVAIIAYVASRTVGLPGMTDDIGHWADPLGLVSVGSETVVVLAAALSLRAMRSPVDLASDAVTLRRGRTSPAT
jgi:hypothetical protein